MKINRLLITGFLTVAILSITSVGIFSFVSIKGVLKEGLSSSLQSTALTQANHVNTFLNGLRNRLIDFSSDGKIKDCLYDLNNKNADGCDSEELSEHLIKNKITVLENAYEIFVLDKNGKLVSTTNAEERSENHPLADSNFLERKQNVFIKGIFFDEEFNLMTLAVSAPIFKKNEFEGVIVAKITPESLYDILADRTALGDSGEIYLVNRDKLMISPSRFQKDEDTILKQIVDFENTGECFFGSSNENKKSSNTTVKHGEVILFSDYRGISAYGAHNYIAELDWCLMTEIGETQTLLPIAKLRNTIIAITAVIAFIVTLFSFYFSRIISSPIIRLRNIVIQLGEGKLHKRIKIKSKSEIGELANAFNKMISKLQNSQKQIKKYSTLLEGKVKKRTAELEDAKKMSEKEVKKMEKMRYATLNILEDAKEAENSLSRNNALLESQYNASLDGIVAIANEGGVMSYNKPFVDIWHMPKSLLKEGNDKKMIQHASEQVLESDKFLQNIKYIYAHKSVVSRNRIEFKDGRIIDMHSVPLKGEENKFFGRAWYFRDITKEAEIDKAKNEFVSLASHQLRTPSTGIKWILQEILRKKNLNKWQMDYVKDALHSTNRLIRLVNDLLNVSRLDAGVLAITSKEMDLYKFVQELAKEAKPIAVEKNQKIVINKPKKTIKASFDPDLIGQVMANLISNAIKYSDEGKTVTIDLAKKSKSVSISIKDQGIGIKEVDQKKLFTKFFRSSEATKYSTTGSGLGLYIIKKILTVANGTIEFSSVRGKGSTFTIILPLKGPIVAKSNTKLIDHRIS